MAKPIIHLEGLCQLWTYDVSHGRMLLRRNKGDNAATRVDILFINVVFIEIPSSFQSISIEDLAAEEIQTVAPRAGEWSKGSSRHFRLKGRNTAGYVVAGNIFWHEDGGSYSEPSCIFKPSRLMETLSRNGVSKE